MLTKSEQRILDAVRKENQKGCFAGIGTDPHSPNFSTLENRFVKRLFDHGALLWMPYSNKFGMGWCLPEFAPDFISKGYVAYTFNYHYVRVSDKKRFDPQFESHWSTIFNVEGPVPMTDSVKWCGDDTYISSSSGESYTRIKHPDQP